MNETHDISEMIKILRTKHGITQKELATYTGLSLSSIIAYENKKRQPNSKAMVARCRSRCMICFSGQR